MKRLWSVAVLSFGIILAGISNAEAAELRGNPSSKVYHIETCQYYAGKSATAQFKTEAEAQAQGYKACKACVLAPAKLPKATNEPYVGNAKTKVFHKAGCKVAPKKDPVGIQNLLQAHKNGFKPCKTCNPSAKAATKAAAPK
ncbi:Ada metal-binding domain-containing protein [Mailhella sp.]